MTLLTRRTEVAFADRSGTFGTSGYAVPLPNVVTMRTRLSRSFHVSVVATFAVAASLVSAAPVTAAESDYPTTKAAAQAAIEKSLKDTGATSITAGLTDLNGLIWQGTTGVIDAGGGAPGPDTIYGIGSTSKMFATAAVMQLVDEGRVELDAPVVRYLPQFTMRSPQYRQITVRMLLDHSAGFPGSTYANGFTTAAYDGYATEVLANLARSSLKTTPGAMSVYCNDCFTVAGELVAEVSGMPFTTYVDQEILAPLGMTESEYITGALPPAGTVARVVKDGANAPFEVTNVYASGGLMSTPTDMLAFARMLMAGGTVGSTELLKASSISEMGTLQLRTTLNPITQSEWQYGLGWDTVNNLTLKAVGVKAWVKGGDTMDYHAGLVIAPEAGLAAFVAGAGSYGSSKAEAVAEEIILNALVERGDLPAMPAKVGTDQPAKVTPTEADIQAMLGTYVGSPSIYRRVIRGDDDNLILESLVNGAWVPGSATLSYRADGSWWVNDARALSFTTVKGWGRTYLVITMPMGYGNARGEEIFGQRVTPGTPIARAWRERLGPWLAVSEAPTSMTWLGSPVTTIARIPGLTGYLDVHGMSAVDARKPDIGAMFLQVPLMFGRDLDDLVPINATTLRMGSSVMVDRDSVAPLKAGTTSVRIGAQAYGEWRAVARATRVTVRGADAWFVYDGNVSLTAHGTRPASDVPVPAGGLVLVFGDAGDTVKVTTK